MKKGLFALSAGLFLLASCDHFKSASTGGETGAGMNDRNLANHKAVIHVIETGDVSSLDSLMAKDVVDHEGNMGKDIVGLDSVKFYLGNAHKYFENMKMEVMQSATSPDGQYFYATVHMTGKAKANPWGMPEGMQIDDTSTDLVKIKDGKATDHWSFESMKNMMEMMNAPHGDGTAPGSAAPGGNKKQPMKMDSAKKM
jgi:hypothetical protein